MRKFGLVLAWALVALLLWLALKDVSWGELGVVLGRLQAWQIAVLVLVNAGIVLLFGARWWLILRAQGTPVPFFLAAGYRLAAFAVSYLTPGPHFGGEPLQVALLRRRHAVPAGQAIASIGLDKLLELCANFAFLTFGVAVLLNGGLIDGRLGAYGLIISLFLLLLPLAYLAALAFGAAPLTRLVPPVFHAVHGTFWDRVRTVIVASEKEAGRFVSAQPATFIAAVLLSGVVWAALLFEYSLVIAYLGLHFNLWQILSLVTGARIAILLPLPAGLGAMEAALVLLSQVLGEGAAVGAGISLLIRARDLTSGLVGLGLGAVWMSPRKKISFDPP